MLKKCVLFFKVEGAYAHLMKYHGEAERDVRFVVTCNGSSKGIHIRDEADKKQARILVNFLKKL